MCRTCGRVRTTENKIKRYQLNVDTLTTFFLTHYNHNYHFFYTQRRHFFLISSVTPQCLTIFFCFRVSSLVCSSRLSVCNFSTPLSKSPNFFDTCTWLACCVSPICLPQIDCEMASAMMILSLRRNTKSNKPSRIVYLTTYQ